jgi:hypothetical protein
MAQEQEQDIDLAWLAVLPLPPLVWTSSPSIIILEWQASMFLVVVNL